MNILDMITGEKEDNNAAVPVPARLKKNEKVLILTGENAEDNEFFYPYYRLNEEGYTVDVATPDGGAFECKHGNGLKETQRIGDLNASDYVLLYLPGGKAPLELSKNETVIRFVQEYAASGHPVAAICHGTLILAKAGLISGRQVTAWPGIADDVKNAGGTFVNEALVIDGPFITSRKPGDLHRHLAGVMDYLRGAVANESRAKRKAGV